MIKVEIQKCLGSYPKMAQLDSIWVGKQRKVLVEDLLNAPYNVRGSLKGFFIYLSQVVATPKISVG